MSKITNDGFTRSDRLLYIPSCAYGNSGRQRVSLLITAVGRRWMRVTR